MKRALMIAVPTIVFLFAAGCETTPVKEEAADATVEERSTAAVTPDEAAAQTRSLESDTGFKGHALDDPSSPLSQQVMDFDFDRSDILDDYRAMVEAHAAYLAENPRSSVVLEGHADERGSREYNLGLGERRGQSVKRMLVLLGASDGQLDTVSFGEERPAREGHDESAWRYNRRVEISYQVR